MTISRRLLLVLGLGLFAVPARAAAPAPVPFDEQAFAAAQAAGRPILVEIAAPWCPACKAQAPILEKLRADPRFNKLVTFTIDFDTQKPFVRRFGAHLQSTLIGFKGKAEVSRSIGETQPEWIEAQLEKSL